MRWCNKYYKSITLLPSTLEISVLTKKSDHVRLHHNVRYSRTQSIGMTCNSTMQWKFICEFLIFVWFYGSSQLVNWKAFHCSHKNNISNQLIRWLIFPLLNLLWPNLPANHQKPFTASCLLTYPLTFADPSPFSFYLTSINSCRLIHSFPYTTHPSVKSLKVLLSLLVTDLHSNVNF